MAIVPPFLRSTVDPVLQKVRRSAPYVRRYNNSLGLRINETYVRYSKACAASFAARSPGHVFEESLLGVQTAQTFKGLLAPEKAKQYSEKISVLLTENVHVIHHDAAHKKLLKTIKQPLRTLGTDYLEIFRAPTLHKALLDFFKSDYRLEWVSAFRSLASDAIASSWNWHTDSFPPCTCKLFIHLTPATPESGATHFMSPADTSAYRRAGYYGDSYAQERRMDDIAMREFAQQHNLPYKPYSFDAQPGDVTLFNMNYMHRAVAPHAGFRDVIEIYLLPNPVSWDQQLAKDGIDALEVRQPPYPKDPHRA